MILQGPEGPQVDSEAPVVFWKNLEMFWSCLGVPRGGLESSRRVWRCPRGVSLRSEGPQGFRESSRGLQWGF